MVGTVCVYVYMCIQCSALDHFCMCVKGGNECSEKSAYFLFSFSIFDKSDTIIKRWHARCLGYYCIIYVVHCIRMTSVVVLQRQIN